MDEDSEAHILNGTCAMTKEARNPWYIVDLGMEVTVYGVELTTPIPLGKISISLFQKGVLMFNIPPIIPSATGFDFNFLY